MLEKRQLVWQVKRRVEASERKEKELGGLDMQGWNSRPALRRYCLA
jgi:hypothetical protein